MSFEVFLLIVLVNLLKAVFCCCQKCIVCVMFQLLVSFGASLFVENGAKETPCDCAEKHGYAQIALYLESKMVFSVLLALLYTPSLCLCVVETLQCFCIPHKTSNMQKG